MLYAITRQLASALKAQGVPVDVVYGPELTVPTQVAERVLIWRPRDEKRDATLATKAVHVNPRMPWVRQPAARLRAFARSSLAGARVHDHEERADQIIDMVMAQLTIIVRARKNTVTWGGGGIITLPDEAGSSLWPGVVYELDFSIDRGVFGVTWKGDAAEEVTIGEDVTIRSTTKVSNAAGAAGVPPDSAEEACGG